MKKLKYTIIVLFLTSFAYCQTYSKMVSDKDIENLVAQAVNLDRIGRNYKIKRKIVRWDKANLNGGSNTTFQKLLSEIKFRQARSLNEKLETLLDSTDLEFLERQFLYGKLDQRWNSFITKLDKYDGKKTKEVGYTLPLFNMEKNTAVIYKETDCGSLCGSGDILIYKKGENGWELKSSYNCWMK